MDGLQLLAALESSVEWGACPMDVSDLILTPVPEHLARASSRQPSIL